MTFTYLAVISGGIGPGVWDREVSVSGEGMTIRQALDEVEKQIESSDAVVISIEQVD
jgi:hypothetical protein